MAVFAARMISRIAAPSMMGLPQRRIRISFSDVPALAGPFTLILPARAADRNAVDAQRGLADPDRNALAVLAARADAVVEFEIVADHGDAVQIGRTIADQHGALDRRATLAVLDAVGLGAFEHVFAGGDVNLPAAEMHRVDAVLHRSDDLLRVAV